MKNKKILIFSLALVGILTCFIAVHHSFKGEKNNVLEQGNSSIDENSYVREDGKQVYNEFYSPFLAVDYSKKNNINRDADYIAIIRIDSLESSNWDSINNQYVAVYSKGKATVLTVLKGDLSSTISYRRLGGQIGYNEWMKGSVDKKKMDSIIGIPTNPDNVIINSQKEDDIQLEVGKTYLVFMTQYSCCNLENEYTIMAYEYGVRELQQQTEWNTLSMQEVGDLKVKDNKTGNWVKLSDVVNLNVSE